MTPRSFNVSALSTLGASAMAGLLSIERDVIHFVCDGRHIPKETS